VCDPDADAIVGDLNIWDIWVLGDVVIAVAAWTDVVGRDCGDLFENREPKRASVDVLDREELLGALADAERSPAIKLVGVSWCKSRVTQGWGHFSICVEMAQETLSK